MGKLASMLSAAMGWTESHAHALRVGDGYFTTLSEDSDEDEIDEDEVTVLEALGDEQEAMRQLEETLAADHPTLIRGWASLAALQYMMGQPEQARAAMERALRSAEITYGPAHPLLADLLMSDAVVLDKLKRKREARQARNRAQRILGSQARTAQEPTAWNVRQGLAEGQVYLHSK